jgi:hypothetical protein
MTDVTMTVQLTADSEAGSVTEMLIWTDSMTQTTWQTFSTFYESLVLFERLQPEQE